MHVFLCNCIECCVYLQTLIKLVEGGVVLCCWDVSRQNRFGVKPQADHRCGTTHLLHWKTRGFYLELQTLFCIPQSPI